MVRHSYKIPREEAGELGICTPVSFRATQLAIVELLGKDIPQRGDLRIIAAFPKWGVCITKPKTGEGREGDFKVILPEGTSMRNLTRENYTFTFIQESSSGQVKI